MVRFILLNFICSCVYDCDFQLERNRDKLVNDGAVPILVRTLQSTNDFTLKLACTATLWNMSVNGVFTICILILIS